MGGQNATGLVHINVQRTLIYNQQESIWFVPDSLALAFTDLKTWDDNSLSRALSHLHVGFQGHGSYLPN